MDVTDQINQDNSEGRRRRRRTDKSGDVSTPSPSDTTTTPTTPEISVDNSAASASADGSAGRRRRRERGATGDESTDVSSSSSSPMPTSSPSPSSSATPRKASAAVVDDDEPVQSDDAVESKFRWIPDDEQGFILSEIVKQEGKLIHYRNDQNEMKTVDSKAVFKVNPPHLDGIADMAGLSYLSEASVLHNLRTRYDKNQIYTYSGLFLVVINPYKNLPIYTNEVVKRYQGRRRGDVDPHVFAVSDAAYRQLLQNQKDQSMLVTGESGAGKTENTKKVIQYLTQVAGSGTGGGKLEQQLIETNPLLEAFGNAKTLKNNNSSRFGKFIEIDFNAKGYIAGTKIDHYLLETTRVTSQHQDERNFHIFYQLTSDAEVRKKYFLQSAGHYKYLANSGCLVVEGINDEKEFKDTVESMRIIGMTESEIDSALTVVAVVLHLGNVEFAANHDDLSVIKDRDPLNFAAKLLGVNPDQLLQALQNPTYKVGNQNIQRHVTPKEAKANLDSLVKSMYLRLFEWLVSRINQSLATHEKIKNFIGVLDIAGFEIFENNSFEQLCINFTNEKLQQFFNNHMFKKEQEEYAEERIQWTFQDFGLDLQPTIDLIEAVPQGILDILNDVSKFNGATDENFCTQVVKVHEKKPVFSRFKFDQLSFVVKHYAGDVTYNTRQWLVKNVDPLNDDCRACMQKAGNDFVKKMFSTAEDLDARMRSTKKSTVAFKYTLQLTKLMDNLRRTEPHFIRCIKPNEVKKPGIIEAQSVLEQLRCNGVLEGIRISRQGYPGRIKYQDFVKRYSLLVTARELEEHATAKAKTEYIVKAKGLEHIKMYQMGLNKIFLKAGVEAKLEEFREGKLNGIIITAQAALKGAVGRKRYANLLKQVSAAQMLQKNYRAFCRLKEWPWFQLYQRCKPLIEKVLEERKLRDARKQIEELKQRIINEVENQKKAEEDKRTLTRDLEKMRAEIDLANDKFDRLNQQYMDLKDELVAKERERSIFTNDKESAIHGLQQIRTAINDMNQRLERKSNEIDQLKQRISESELSMQRLSGDVKGKENDIAKYAKRIQTLTKDLRDLKDKLDDDHNETLGQVQVQRNLDNKWRETQAQMEAEERIKNEKEAEIKKSEEDLAKLDKELNKVRKSGSSLENDVDKVRKDKNTLSENIYTKQKEVEDLQRQKQQADASNMDWQRKLDEETRNRQSAETKQRMLKSDIADCASKATQVSETNANLEDVISQLKNQIAELQDKLSALNEEKAAAQAKNDELNKTLKDTRFNLEDELQRTKTDLDRATKKYEAAVRDYNDQVDQANQAKANLEKKFRQCDNDTRALKRQYDELARQLGDAESKIRRLDQELNDGDQDKETIRREISQVENEKRELESTKKDLESQLQATKEDLARTAAARKQLQVDLDNEKERLSGVEGEKEALEQAKVANEAKKKKLGEELTSEKNAQGQLRSDLQNASSTLQDLQGKYAQLQSQVESASGDSKSLGDRIHDLNTELENERAAKLSLEKKKRQLETDIKKMKEDLANEQEKLKRELAQKQNVEGSLRDSTAAQEAEKRSNEDLQRQLADLQSELQATKKKLAESEENLNELKSDRAELKKSKEDLDEELEDLQGQLSDLEKELKNLDSGLKEENNKANQLTAARGQLETENNRLKSELDRVREEVGLDKKNLLNAIDQLKTQLGQQQADREREIKKLSDERNDLKNDLKSAKKKLDAASKDPHNSKEYENLRRDYELQLAKLKKQYEEEQTARLDSEAKKKMIETQIEDLKNQLSNAEKNRKKVETQKRQLAMEVDELRDLAEEADALREEIVHLKSDGDSLLTSLKSDLLNERTRRIQGEEASARTKRELEELKSDLQLERSKVDDQQRRLQQQYEAEIEDLHQLLAKAKRDKASDSRSGKKNDRELKELSRKLQQEQDEKEDALSKASQLEREVKQMKMKQDKASVTLNKLEADKRRMEQSAQSLKQKAIDLEDEIARLRAEADEERGRRSKMSKKASAARFDDDDY